MQNTNIVAAIVLGSNKITGIVGTKEIDGSVKVKAHATHNSTDFIGKGRVLNVEKMTSCLSSIKQRLEESSSYRIKKVYAAINCQGLRSITNEVNYNLSTSELVTDEVLNLIDVRNRDAKPAGRDILEAIPLEYRLGSKGAQRTNDPKGMLTDAIQTRFLNIICSSNTVATIAACFRKAGIELAGGRLYVAAQHLAAAVTSEQERSTGCVVVDLGTETTTVAVYKSKFLRHLVVLPIGYNSIVRDVETVFNVERGEAENLIATIGYPSPDKLEDRESLIHLRDGGRSKKISELAGIIDARMEEIVQNVDHQIKSLNFTHEHLVNGLYLTSNAEMLKNVDEAFKRHFKEWNVHKVTKGNVRFGCSEHNFNADGLFNVALSICNTADINCYGGDYEGIFGHDGPTPEEIAAEEERKREEQRRLDEMRRKVEQELLEKSREETAVKDKEEAPEKPHRKSNSLGKFWSNAKKMLQDIVSEPED